MATIFRLDYLGAIHHVFVRGNDKRDIFLDDSDRIFFLRRLERLKAEMGFKLYAFCLMTNHLHLLVETGKDLLKSVMGRLLSVYATRFHRRNGSVGHVFQGPYGAKLCTRDAYFLRLVRYIHRNPVQANICLDPSQWRWSGHLQLAEGIAGPLDEDLPLSFFGDDAASARAAYARFCLDSQDDQDACFVPEAPRLGPASELASIADEVAASFGFAAWNPSLVGRGHAWTEAKLDFLSRAVMNGHSQSAVAAFLGVSSPALSGLKARAKKLKS